MPVFPDQVVVCGAEYAFVPYVDPGQSLALAVREAVLDQQRTHGEWPRVLLIANHGMVALGQTADVADNITLMMAKAAAIVLGALTAGGVRPLANRAIARLLERDSERLRAPILRGEGERARDMI